MSNRADDWLRQAERDLEHVQACIRDQRHEWACFAAHQAAEKAVKALHLARGQEAWGHVVRQLLQELPCPVDEPLLDRARTLDGFYIPTRCPNGHPDGAPFEHFGALQSGEALEYASAIVAFCRHEMADPQDR